MAKKEFLIYSLTTRYAESTKFNNHFVHALNKELIKLGIKIKTITPHAKNLLTQETIDKVVIRRFRYLPENYQINFSSIPDELSKSKIGYLKMIAMTFFFFSSTLIECMKEKPDIIHAHWSFPCGYIAYLMSKIFKTKFVITIHGGEIPLFKKFPTIRKLVINAMNKSVLVCANSSYSKNEFIKMGVKENKIIKLNVPPNFVKHTSDKIILESFRKKFTPQSNKIVLFCGRLAERKGVEYLIRAIVEIKLNNIHLIISGDGDLRNKLENIAKQLGLTDKVTFFGHASDAELGMLHDISDVFVCPSIIDSKGNTEYLGLVIPEAMESGLPVIASSVGGIIDTVKNEVNGILVPQKDPKSIARALERVIGDEVLAKKLVENSKATVKEFFPQTIAQEYAKIFQNCISK